MWRLTWWLNLAVGLLPADSAAEDLAFCTCSDATCEGEGDPSEPACISFDEAADLAAQPDSGVHALTTAVEPIPSGAIHASAANADAICRRDLCYVKRDGQVELAAYGHQTVFFGWSGCSDRTEPHLTLGPLTASSQCVAHFGPGLIVVHTAVSGRDDDAKVQIDGSRSGSGQCSFLHGGSVTLSAPPSDARARFVGWSGCSMSSEPTLRFEEVKQALPECVAQYAASTPSY